MTDHEKRIREALAEGSCLVTMPELRALLSNLDAVRGALKQCHSTLTDERLGQWHYMEGSQIYSDFKQAADRADAALKGATHEPEFQDDYDNDDPWLSGDDMMGASG